MKSQLNLKLLSERVATMAVNRKNEPYIREALHAVFNTETDCESIGYSELCKKYTRVKFMSFERAKNGFDRYGNLAFFMDELIFAVDKILKPSGVDVNFECDGESVFICCNFEYAYYTVVSLIRSAADSGATEINVKISKRSPNVTITVEADSPFSSQAETDARAFARNYSGSFLICIEKGRFTAIINTVPESNPETEIADMNTDFLYDRLSPVYIALGIAPS